MVIAAVASNTPVELVFGQAIHQLGEHRPAVVHAGLLLWDGSRIRPTEGLWN